MSPILKKKPTIIKRDRSGALASLIDMGDFHATYINPQNRIDDYRQTLLTKFEWILNEGLHTSLGIIQVGDFFNSFKTPIWFIAQIAYMLRISKCNCFSIYGQHDMKYHSPDISGVPLNLLNKAGLVDILNDEPLSVPKHSNILNDFIHIYGSSWGEPIPEIIDPSKFNILVTHRMVVKNKLWSAQTDFVYATELEKTGFDLILSGDNHQKFQIGKVINAGSVMRSTSAQIDHIPAIFKIWIWPDKYYEVEEIPIPIEPAEKVFNLEKVEREKKETKEMEQFANGLDSDFDISDMKFWDIVQEIIKENPIDESTNEILEEIKYGL